MQGDRDCNSAMVRAVISGTLDPGSQRNVCSDVREKGALGFLNSSSRIQPPRTEKTLVFTLL